MGRLGAGGWLRVLNRVGRIWLRAVWQDRAPLVLLSGELIQEGSQLEGVALQQRVGPGCEQGEPSHQLPLCQGQARELGVVDEALPAEDGVVNTAT